MFPWYPMRTKLRVKNAVCKYIFKKSLIINAIGGCYGKNKT